MKNVLNKNSKKIIVLISALFLSVMCCFFNTDSTYAYKWKFDDIYYLDGGASGVEDKETITYERKEIVSFILDGGIPQYYNENNSIYNACANVAGAEVVGFYDKYYDNFIPDFTTGAYYNGKYIYYSQVGSDQVQNVINNLYTLMGTNTVNPGTSVTQFASGLGSYVSDKGKTASFTSVKSGDNVDVSKLDTQLRGGYPVAFFCSTYNIITRIDDTSTSTTLNKFNYGDNHIMLSSGYKTYKFFKTEVTKIWKPLWYNPFNYEYVYTEVNFRTDTYIVVSTGWSSIEFAYVKLYDDIVVDSAYAIKVN